MGKLWIGGNIVGRVDSDGKVWNGGYGGNVIGRIDSDGKVWDDGYGGSIIGRIDSDGRVWNDGYGGSIIGRVDSVGKVWNDGYGGSVIGRVEGKKLANGAALLLFGSNYHNTFKYRRITHTSDNGLWGFLSVMFGLLFSIFKVNKGGAIGVILGVIFLIHGFVAHSNMPGNALIIGIVGMFLFGIVGAVIGGIVKFIISCNSDTISGKKDCSEEDDNDNEYMTPIPNNNEHEAKPESYQEDDNDNEYMTPIPNNNEHEANPESYQSVVTISENSNTTKSLNEKRMSTATKAILITTLFVAMLILAFFSGRSKGKSDAVESMNKDIVSPTTSMRDENREIPRVPTPPVREQETPPPSPSTVPMDDKIALDDEKNYLEAAVSQRLLTESDLRGLSKQQLRILRNTIFARHGRRFVSPDLQEYFGAKDWYRPQYDEVTHLLNAIEIKNVQIIQKHE